VAEGVSELDGDAHGLLEVQHGVAPSRPRPDARTAAPLTMTTTMAALLASGPLGRTSLKT